MSLPGWLPTEPFQSELQEKTLIKPRLFDCSSLDDDLDDVCSNGSSDTTALSSYNSSPRIHSIASDALKSPALDSSLPPLGCQCSLSSDDSMVVLQSRMSAAIPFNCTCSHTASLDVDATKLARLADEFRAQRMANQANALMWSVEHASSRGIIPKAIEQSLYHLIGRGAFDEARDVLYRQCHLTPAVHNLVSKGPLSATPPPPDDALDKSALAAFVNARAPIDTAMGRRHKHAVLRELSTLVVTWVKRVGMDRGLTLEHVALTSGALFAAGSYRLAIDDPTSDIDTVAVAPWHVTQADFFGSFVDLLRSCPAVSSLTPVTNAFVPLIALVYDNVALDILFARLPMPTVLPSQDIDSDYILAGVDPASMKSLNAPRVSTLVLRLVPQPHLFRSVVRAIRTWARARGIYSSKWGYLGGVSWTILVAFVCQMYPHDTDCESVFLRFFQVMSEWAWPQPVMLNVLYDAGLGLESWDPRLNVFDRTHVMPIITPAYPPMNSAVQVSHTTFKIIHEELWRARHFAELAHANPDEKNAAWSQLFAPTNFFIRYDVYLGMSYTAQTKEEMCVWSKFVHSRVRKLVDGLQHVKGVARVHALPTHFPVHTPTNQDDVDASVLRQCVFIGLEFKCAPGSSRRQTLADDPHLATTIDQTIRFFEATDMQQFGVRAPGMALSTSMMQWENLPEFVFAHGREKAAEDRVVLHTSPPSHPPPPRSAFAFHTSFGMPHHHSRHKNKAKKSKRKDKAMASSTI
ncbi:hypothetical protein DYB32_000558 [Aphanomyces invadans]|uniref:polynucleotide adenylyltransferase n=1 Tax=Aphanomyces invadans TaxID=157072 RepID=A0A418B9K0_9STRA|nr:hypothetical protein DYB32_000558 [Aphanomyces invadans]